MTFSLYIFMQLIDHDCYPSVPSVNMTYVARLPSHQQNVHLFSMHSLLLSLFSTTIHHTSPYLYPPLSCIHFLPFIIIHLVTYNCCINNLDEQSLEAETFDTLNYNERAPRFRHSRQINAFLDAYVAIISHDQTGYLSHFLPNQHYF